MSNILSYISPYLHMRNIVKIDEGLTSIKL